MVDKYNAIPYRLKYCDCLHSFWHTRLLACSPHWAAGQLFHGSGRNSSGRNILKINNCAQIVLLVVPVPQEAPGLIKYMYSTGVNYW